MTTTPSPIEQFIQKFEELERAMTKGPWRAEVDDDVLFTRIIVDTDGRHLVAESRGWNREVAKSAPNFAGIAHLKNSNPAVIEMLKAAIEGLRRCADTEDDGCIGPWNDAAISALAHINTLAQEALGT